MRGYFKLLSDDCLIIEEHCKYYLPAQLRKPTRVLEQENMYQKSSN